MFLVLICYDIADNRRRLRVRKALLGFGDPIQESVFEAFVDARRFERLRAKVAERLGPEDRVRYYRLCAACEERGISGVPESHPRATRPRSVVV